MLPGPAAGASVSLQLSEEERQALIRVFYVVKDNWWLDEREQSLLERLLAGVAAEPAGSSGSGANGL